MKTSIRPFAKTFKPFLPLKEDFIQNRWALALGLMSLLAVDFLQLLIPLVIKKAIDLLTAQIATGAVLLRQAAMIALIALFMGLFRYIWRLLILGHSRVIEKRLRKRMYRRLQTLSPGFYGRTKTGDLMARAINDINAIRMATGMGLVALTDGLVLGMAAIGFMMSINVTLTLISLIPAPIIVFLTRVLTRRMSLGFERVQNTFADLTERVREAFAGIRVIKAYHRESWTCERVKEEGEKYIAENMDLARSLAFFFPMMAVFTNTGLAIVIWLGGRFAILGDITTGDFVAFASYLNLLTWPMMAMGWVTNLVQRGSASMRRINRILDETPEIRDMDHPKARPTIQGGVRIQGLHFRYPGQRADTLRDVHLHIDPGETVALVGRVGAGKTTLLHAIPRLINPPWGAVFLDGVDVRHLPLKGLRRNIGFVTQEVFLFSDTIRNNILLGAKDVSETALEAVLRASDLLEEVKATEKGLDTHLGERGATLSGGQRQRVTLARALVLDPAILILDDALSMVDTATEERILNQVLQLRRQKTNLIVSHRVPTISRANRIYVMESGEIKEQGTHETLLARGDIYATLYERQLLAQELGMEG